MITISEFILDRAATTDTNGNYQVTQLVPGAQLHQIVGTFHVSARHSRG